MVKETKLYDLLGVKPDANDNDIKKGYRKAALKYHPDKPTGDTEKFKEISEAFDILSSSDKRQLYDTYGLEAARRGGVMPDAGGAGPDAGAGGFAGGFPGGFPGGGQQQGGFSFGGMPGGAGGPGGARTFHFTSGGGGPGGGYTPFSGDDAFNIFRHFTDSGGMEGEDDDIFSMLNGGRSGRSSRAPGGFPGGFPGGRSASPEKQSVTLKLPLSLEDLASGTTKKMKIKRKGPGGRQEEKLISISIKPGWKAGTKLTYPNEGDRLPDGSAQDVVFVVEEKPHPRFTRDGNNLKTKLKLSLKEALCGFTKIVETIDGKKLKVEFTRPISPGHVIEYPSHGMPISKQPGQKGNLIITVDVEFPSQLTSAQRKAIEDTF